MPQPRILIDLAAIAGNYAFLCEKTAPAQVGAAVKADAYGLGAAQVAGALHKAGCKVFFTAYFHEAMALRPTLPDAALIPLHGIDEADFEAALAHNIMPVLNDLGAIAAWQAFARRKGRPLPALIHLDTAMSRLGLPPDEQKKLIENPQSLLEGVEVKAWVSHLACADEFDKPHARTQRDAFAALIAALPPAPASLSSSSGIFWGPDFVFDLVRPGIALLGGNPTPHLPNPMRPVVTLQAPVLQIRNAEAGRTVGYGAAHKLTRPSRIATVALGYADGYLRALGGKGVAMIEGHAAPIVGRVSMDLITLDVTDVPEAVAHPGAWATLIGPHRTLDQAAAEGGVISYEILARLGPRVARVYGTAP